MWMIALGCLSILVVTAGRTRSSIGPDEACKDFTADNNSTLTWTLADCTEVWTQFVETIPPGLLWRMTYVDDWRETATELRRAESPCLSAMHGGGDGLGSTTLRILSSWIFSAEMGCDWVTPDWGKRRVSAENGTVLYCHPVVTRGENALHSPEASALVVNARCTVVDWLAYFQLGVPSTSLPDEARIKRIEVK